MSHYSKSKVVVCRIRLFPTLISKIKWPGSELPLTFTILELVWIVRYMFGVYRIYHLLQNWKKLMIKRSVPWQPTIIFYLPEVLILSKSGNLTLIKVSLFRAHFGSYQIKCGASSRGSSSLYFSCGIRTKWPWEYVSHFTQSKFLEKRNS